MGKQAPRDADGARIPLMVRTTQSLREKMEAAIKQSGRSLAQEAELRLERSFAADETRTIIREEFARLSPERRRPCGRSADMLCPHFPPNGHICVCEGVHGMVPSHSVRVS